MMSDIEVYLDAYYQTGRFSGNVLAARGEEVLFARGYGLANREHGVPNTLATKFRLGSITKQFTAVAILQLQDRGLLSVHAPIAAYLPDYPQGDRLTLHHLLTHTAGLPNYTNSQLFPDFNRWMRLPTTLDDLVARFKHRPLEFEPGAKYRYSNSGYVLLTQVIEHVSGQAYADYLEANLFQPLGMVNSGYQIPEKIIPHMADGYVFLGNNTYERAEPVDMSTPQGAGGAYSTITDLLIWTQWLHRPKGDPAPPILSAEAIAALITPMTPISPDDAPDSFYGYGLWIDRHLARQRISHGGGINGFVTMLTHSPVEALTIAVLANFFTVNAAAIARDLAAIVFGEPYQLPKQHQIANVDPAIYPRYTGVYKLRLGQHLAQQDFKITVESDQLMGQFMGQKPFVLYPISETEFFDAVLDFTLKFNPAEDGSIHSLTLYQGGQERFAPRVDSVDSSI